jgi:transcriptional regulator with PAS, ATPase and Fis domain
VFEAAAGGSLLLDELGELPLHLQAKLLGVLDDRKVKRIGSQTARHVDTRVLAATNLPLEQAMHRGSFRQDLYYRLSVIVITMPPLRSHLDDLPRLCDYFLRLLVPQRDLAIDPGDLDLLRRYHWPGNVRELRNILERAVILQKGPTLFPSRLLNLEGPTARSVPPAESPAPAILSLKAVEREHIRNVLTRCGYNHSHTVKALEISRSTLIRKIKTYGLGNGGGTPRNILS